MSQAPRPPLALGALLAAGCMIAATTAVRADTFIDLGMASTRVEADIPTLPVTASTQSGWHVGVGVRRALRAGDIGVRVELDDVDSNLLLSVRAFDYRHSFSDRFALGAFVGAARLDLATPAYGYYIGAGVQLKELLPSWDLSIDLRLGDKIARDNLLPTDPPTIDGRNDSFYDLRGISVYLSRRF
jgi:hypothetical protein